jgi:hypothetical protein
MKWNESSVLHKKNEDYCPKRPKMGDPLTMKIKNVFGRPLRKKENRGCVVVLASIAEHTSLGKRTEA